MEMSFEALSMLLCVHLSLVSGQANTVIQTPSILDIWEKETAVINCTYTNVAYNYFPWYKKDGRKGFTLLTDIRSNVNRKTEGRFTVILDKNAKLVSLHITAAHAEDSALYLCASSAQCFAGTYSLNANMKQGLQ
ncbi:AABR07017902.3 [Phodopus roborovskii]|uniref:AABR07017902.3 protein n=1 Tax=Phodopus roborovskii TaxID=109678 RepID=A0AAU9ZQ12_PHORO|nr:AABR07017902.3 [Phodopus roborovskii]